MGRETLYRVNCPLGSITVLEPGSAIQRRIGDDVALAFRPENTMLYENRTDTLLEGVRIEVPG